MSCGMHYHARGVDASAPSSAEETGTPHRSRRLCSAGPRNCFNEQLLDQRHVSGDHSPRDLGTCLAPACRRLSPRASLWVGMQASAMAEAPNTQVERLRDLRTRSVHVRNGLYLYESGVLSFRDMVTRLRQVAGDEELFALGLVSSGRVVRNLAQAGYCVEVLRTPLVCVEQLCTRQNRVVVKHLHKVARSMQRFRCFQRSSE